MSEPVNRVLLHLDSGERRVVDPAEVYYLEVLEAQRSLFETKQRTLEALARYHVARAALDELMVPDGTAVSNPIPDPNDFPEENRDD